MFDLRVYFYAASERPVFFDVNAAVDFFFEFADVRNYADGTVALG